MRKIRVRGVAFAHHSHSDFVPGRIVLLNFLDDFQAVRMIRKVNTNFRSLRKSFWITLLPSNEG